MPDDLVIGLSMETQDFLREMQGANNALKNLGDQGQKTNTLLSRMNWGMAASGLAIGFQDAASVLSNGGSFGMALNAAGNNLIQVAAMAHPVAGAVSAIAIAGAQLAPLFSNAKDEMQKLKEESERAKKEIEGAFSYIGRMADARATRPQAGIGASEADANRHAELNREIEHLRARQQERMDFLRTQQETNSGVNIHDPAVQAYRQKVLAEVAELRQQEIEKEHTAQALRARNQGKEFKTTEQIRQEAEARKAIGDQVKERVEKEKQVEEAIRKQTAELRQQEEQWKANLDAQHRADAEAVRSSILNPREQLSKEALRLSFLPLSDEERTKSLMKQAAMAFNGGPQLSAGLVKGTIEEESSKNRREAEQRNKEFIKQMVKDIIRELKPKEPPPEVVVGGGH